MSHYRALLWGVVMGSYVWLFVETLLLWFYYSICYSLCYGGLTI